MEETVSVLGVAIFIVQYERQTNELNLYVFWGDGPSLLGYDWLQVVTLDWKFLHKIIPSSLLGSILASYALLFKEGLGMAREVTAKMHVDPSE